MVLDVSRNMHKCYYNICSLVIFKVIIALKLLYSFRFTTLFVVFFFILGQYCYTFHYCVSFKRTDFRFCCSLFFILYFSNLFQILLSYFIVPKMLWTVKTPLFYVPLRKIVPIKSWCTIYFGICVLISEMLKYAKMDTLELMTCRILFHLFYLGLFFFP